MITQWFTIEILKIRSALGKRRRNSKQKLVVPLLMYLLFYLLPMAHDTQKL
jgi:hypothetical protein